MDRLRIGLSSRLKVPCLKVGRFSFPPWFYWKIRKIEKTGLLLDDESLHCMVFETDDNLDFPAYYPPLPLEDKTILDIGAGCGETAWFFLRHGAKKVVCIEKDHLKQHILGFNKEKLRLNLEIIPEAFNINQLVNNPHDFIKCDIEGYEMNLQPYADKLKPCIVEVHNWWIADQFRKKGFRMLAQQPQDELARKSAMIGISLMYKW